MWWIRTCLCLRDPQVPVEECRWLRGYMMAQSDLHQACARKTPQHPNPARDPMTKPINPTENRKFEVNDRVCKRPVRNAIATPNTPEMKPTRKGIIVSRKQVKQRSKTAVAGHALRWQSEIRWDDSERTDWVDDIRIIHEAELQTHLS